MDVYEWCIINTHLFPQVAEGCFPTVHIFVIVIVIVITLCGRKQGNWATAAAVARAVLTHAVVICVYVVVVCIIDCTLITLTIHAHTNTVVTNIVHVVTAAATISIPHQLSESRLHP
jgi:hypothetical protein